MKHKGDKTGELLMTLCITTALLFAGKVSGALPITWWAVAIPLALPLAGILFIAVAVAILFWVGEFTVRKDKH